MKSFLSILILVSNFVYSQQNSQLGRFSIDYPIGCLPVTISINEHDSFGAISRQYFYEEGLIETPEKFYTYNEAGIYQIVQFLGEDIVPKTDTLIFEVLESLPPIFAVSKCSDTEATINILDQDPYDYHTVWFSETDSVVISESDPSPTYDFGQSTGIVRVKGFYNNAYPTCESNTSTFDLSRSFSESVVSSEVIQVCENEYFLSLELADHSELSFLDIILENTVNRNTLYFGNLKDSINSFQLSSNLIDSTYCIDVNLLNSCDSSILNSSSYCGKINENRANLSKAYAGYVNNDILIVFDSLKGKKVRVKRSSRGKSQFVNLGEYETSFLDQNVVSGRVYDYHLLELDTCGSLLDSVQISPPTIQLTDRNRFLNTISFNAIPPENMNGNYTEEFVFSSEANNNELIFEYQSEYQLPGSLGSTVIVRSKYIYDDFEIFSNQILTPYEEVIFVPSGFTPNNDNLNDELTLFGLPNENFRITIYDRWGVVMLISTDNPVWNGMLKKEIAPEGTYLYQLSFEQEDGTLKEQVGTFTLLKN